MSKFLSCLLLLVNVSRRQSVGQQETQLDAFNLRFYQNKNNEINQTINVVRILMKMDMKTETYPGISQKSVSVSTRAARSF